MPLGQGLLNAWVKVNSKHVVYNRRKREDDADQLDRPSNGLKQKNLGSSGTINSGGTLPTAVSEDVEAQAIRRFNNRKYKRRLRRTSSATDTLHGEVARMGSDTVGAQKTTVGRNGSPPLPSKLVTEHSPQHEDQSVVSIETTSSLRFMSELFGDLESLGNDSLLFDSASLQIAPQAHLDAASVHSRGGQSLPARPYSSNPVVVQSESNESASKGGFRFPQNLFSGDSKAPCRQCSKMESELLAAREDVEYLRELSIQREYVCVSCQANPPQEEKYGHVEPGSALGDSMKMLAEVTARHKSQMEKLTRERERWQHDANVKIHKYADLCASLDQEATLRSEEAIALHREVVLLRTGRDELALELEKAKATISKYERDNLERKEMEQRLLQYEESGLDGAESAIKTRDNIISDLSSRLDKTLNLLAFERQQHLQRRQIIFPSPRTIQASEAGKDEPAAELATTKAALQEAQANLESIRRSSERSEIEWKLRIESLERQLDAARSQ